MTRLHCHPPKLRTVLLPAAAFATGAAIGIVFDLIMPRLGIKTVLAQKVLVQIGSTDMRVPDAAYSFQARSTAVQTAGAIRP